MTLGMYLNLHRYYDNLYDELNQFKSKNDEEKLLYLGLYEIKRLVLPSLGDTEVSSLKALDFLKIYNRMRRSNYSEESVRRLHTVLSDLFTEMEEDAVISDNPLRYLHVDELRTLPDFFLSPSEVRATLDKLSLSSNYNLYRFALYSGLRLNIELALSLGNIDWETGLLTTERLISVNTKTNLFELKKNIAEWSMRKFYLSHKALSVISDEMKRRKEKESVENKNDLIFYNDNGAFITPVNIKNECMRICGDKNVYRLYKQFEIGSYEDLKGGNRDE